MQKDKKLLMLCVKASIAILVICPLCILGSPYEWLASISAWAVITVDCVFESNVGLAFRWGGQKTACPIATSYRITKLLHTVFSKGVNRVIGTFLAGALALIVNHLGPKLGPFHPYFVVFCCSFVTLILTF